MLVYGRPRKEKARTCGRRLLDQETAGTYEYLLHTVYRYT